MGFFIQNPVPAINNHIMDHLLDRYFFIFPMEIDFCGVFFSYFFVLELILGFFFFKNVLKCLQKFFPSFIFSIPFGRDHNFVGHFLFSKSNGCISGSGRGSQFYVYIVFIPFTIHSIGSILSSSFLL